METIVRIIVGYKRLVLLQLFTVYVRYLIGSAFVIAAFGMGKIIKPDYSFKEIASSNDLIGQAFATFIHSDLYWSFIGWSQLVAGLLLITQKFARLGALIFLPIIANIFIITYSYQFHGTDIIAGLMLLATIYLVLWEADKLQYLFIDPNPETVITTTFFVERMKLWQITGAIMFSTIVGLFFLQINLVWIMLICLGEGVVAFVWYAVTERKTRP